MTEMTDFAKLYDTEKYGQILITLDQQEDDSFAISHRAYHEGIEVKFSISGFNSPAKAETYFEKMNEEYAIHAIDSVFESMD